MSGMSCKCVYMAHVYNTYIYIYIYIYWYELQVCVHGACVARPTLATYACKHVNSCYVSHVVYVTLHMYISLVHMSAICYICIYLFYISLVNS